MLFEHAFFTRTGVFLLWKKTLVEWYKESTNDIE